MMKNRHQARRQAKHARQEAENALAWTPPPRNTLDPQDPYAFNEADPRLKIKVHMWRLNGRLADFYIEAIWADPTTTTGPTLIASADCTHHGSIHFHDEIRYPEHDHIEPFEPLRSLDDVATNFNRTLDALIDFADTIARREGMTR